MKSRGVKVQRKVLRPGGEEYDTILRTTPDGFWRLDDEGRFLDVNDAYCRMSGYTRAELLTMNIRDVEAAETPEQIRAHIVQLLTTGFDRFETRHRTRQGRILDVEISSSYCAKSGILYAFIRDITEKKRAQELLRRATERAELALGDAEIRFQMLREHIPDALVRGDMQGRYLEANEAYRQMLGYEEAELQRLGWRDLTPAGWHELEERLLREQVLRRGYSDFFEKEYRRKNGTVFPVEIRIYLVRSATGEPAGLWAIVRDITARKQAEQELVRARDAMRGMALQLEQAREEESVRLAGDLQHELGQTIEALRHDLAWMSRRLTTLAEGDGWKAVHRRLATMDRQAQSGADAVQRMASKLRPALPAGGKPLSYRELEVLRQLACGVPGKSISARLGVSPKTVSTYRRRLLAKLGVSSTAELIKCALLQGWVTP